MTNRPSLKEIEAAARVIFREGAVHGWFPKSVSSYDSLDQIGKDEFDGIVERTLMAAQKARNSN